MKSAHRYAAERPGERIRAGADLVVEDLGRADIAVLVNRRPDGCWALQVLIAKFPAVRIFQGTDLLADDLPEQAAKATRGLIKAIDNHLAQTRPAPGSNPKEPT